MPDSPTPDQIPLAVEPPTADHSTVDWPLRQQNPVRRMLNRLERISLAVERPIARWVRSPQWNPLYHTGTITLFALLIILATGIYLTLFYQFGFDASYQAVATMEANLLGRFMRALHRYASVLAVIAALLHAWRTFFMDRFRGPRWLAWASGIVLLVFLWGAGLTGYWLIFDERAQLFNQALVDLLAGSGGGTAFLNRFMLSEAAGGGWLFALGVLTVHLLLSALIGLLFYIHIKRLRRAKILPPRYWMALLAAPLLLAALLIPVGMLGPADPAQTPAQLPLDLFLLWYVPAALRLPPALFWGGVALVLALLVAVPWLLTRKPLPAAQVHNERCTGCTLCAADCPYRAITMVERAPGSAHKLLAIIDPGLCVSCGICVGSCPPLAITLGDQWAEPLWQQTAARAAAPAPQPVRVVFTCERHAQYSARPYLDPSDAQIFGQGHGRPAGVGDAVQVIPLPCVGMAHPDLARDALAAGAAEVQFVGCPPEDCPNREGNLWMQERVDRRRMPRLRRELAGAPVSAGWLSPDAFPRGLAGQGRGPATSYALGWDKLDRRGLLPALALLVVVLAASILATQLPYRPPAGAQAQVAVSLVHRSGYPMTAVGETAMVDQPPDTSHAAPLRLVVELDGAAALDKRYALARGGSDPTQVLEQLPLTPGEHHVRVLIYDQQGQTEPQVLIDRPVQVAAGQRVALAFHDARLSADPAAGERLFNGATMGANAGCQICHSLKPDVQLVGPSLAGVATRAETRVPGMGAEAYLMQSLIAPDAYVVAGFQPGQMRPDLAQALTQQELDDLVAFLLTLH
jgi:ferredoxin/cytochrome c551/c552